MDNCYLRVPCIGEYGCKPFRLPMDSDSFAPFVAARFKVEGDEGGGVGITVGNESYKQNPNTAIIKSMEFGYMDKPQARLEIVDEAGGEFGFFVDSLRRCGSQLRGKTMELKFGWVKSNCGGFGEQELITFDGWIQMILFEIDVAYGEGLIKYTLQGTALDVVTTNRRGDEVNGPGMRLTDAIQRICATEGITPVFASVGADGKVRTRTDWPQGLSVEEAPWEWNIGGTDGPRGSWQGDNNDVLSTIARWIEPYRIKYPPSGAGILMVFDSKNHNRLFLWQDPRIEQRCPEFNVSGEEASRIEGGGVKQGDRRGSLGTFIVNGGKCSPVIRFDPKINFISASGGKNTGGTASGAENSNAVKPKDEQKEEKDPDCKNDGNEGPQNQSTITQTAKENYAPDIVHKETLKSNMAHIEANMFTEFNISPIHAELTTIGMPTDEFVDFKKFLFAPVSIIVINPFHLAGDMNSGCGDWSWLASSGCNEILSDSQYKCQGVNHVIKEGSYTTTLKVFNVNRLKVKSGAG